MFKILVVCTGNICRSPMAHGLLEAYAHKLKIAHLCEIDSAATSNYEVGDHPDPRAQAVMRQHSYDISHQIARQITLDDFENFDLILYMDKMNQSKLQAKCPPQFQSKLVPILYYAPELGNDVPDPYYGNNQNFAKVFDMLNMACERVILDIKNSIKKL